MDFSRYTNGVIAQIFLLFFLLLSFNSSSSSSVVKAQDDKTIVRTICTQTLEPDACASCILAYKSRASSNMTEMVHSILFCLYSEATYAHQTADHLFQNTAAVRLKQVFHVCTDTLFAAANSFMDAVMKVEASDYEEAQACARAAGSGLFQCVSAFIKCGGYVPIPAELVSHMVQAKRLLEVARFMFPRCKLID